MNLPLIISQIIVIIIPMGSVIPGDNYICKDIVGVYNNDTKIVYVCDTDNIDFIKYHEIGHYIWFNVLKENQKKIYTKMYEKDLNKNNFYRDYSRTNVLEDFADNFAVIMTGEILYNRRINTINNFINTPVKNN